MSLENEFWDRKGEGLALDEPPTISELESENLTTYPYQCEREDAEAEMLLLKPEEDTILKMMEEGVIRFYEDKIELVVN